MTAAAPSSSWSELPALVSEVVRPGGAHVFCSVWRAASGLAFRHGAAPVQAGGEDVVGPGLCDVVVPVTGDVVAVRDVVV
jgi:hypothetical protein